MRVLILELQKLGDIKAGTHPVTKEDITTKNVVSDTTQEIILEERPLTDGCVACCGLQSIKDH